MSKIEKIAALEEENKRLNEDNQLMKSFMYAAIEMVVVFALKIILEIVITINKMRRI